MQECDRTKFQLKDCIASIGHLLGNDRCHSAMLEKQSFSNEAQSAERKKETRDETDDYVSHSMWPEHTGDGNRKLTVSYSH